MLIERSELQNEHLLMHVVPLRHRTPIRAL